MIMVILWLALCCLLSFSAAVKKIILRSRIAGGKEVYRHRVNITLFWLLVTGVLGVALRVYPLTDIQLNFKNILHAHSHAAFLGWVFNALFVLLTFNFIGKAERNRKAFKVQFLLAQLFNAGMLAGFLAQGYAFWSILFSTLHMAVSFWFAISVYKTVRKENAQLLVSHRLLFSTLFFLIISSLGPLFLPVIIKLYGAGSGAYFNAIYFYLHFQYNGWFIFSLFALFFDQLEKNKVSVPVRIASGFHRTLFASCLLTYCLSTLWSHPPEFVRGIGFAGSLVQVASLFLLISAVKKITWRFQPFNERLFRLAFILFAIKILFQLLSALPFFTGIISGSRNLIIGYLHLVLLGIVTLTLLNNFFLCGLTSTRNHLSVQGIVLFVAGMIAGELAIFTDAVFKLWGSGIPHHLFIQVAAAFVMLSGIATLFASSLSHARHPVTGTKNIHMIVSQIKNQNNENNR